MTLQEKKLSLIQGLLLLKDESIIEKIDALIKKGLSLSTTATPISFEEWNQQFNDDQDLNTYVEEYGMTLGDFRRQMYEAETGETMTLESFLALI